MKVLAWVSNQIFNLFSLDFVPGEDFTMEVKIAENGIYTYINSNNQGIFFHRVPIEEIKYLQIWDGIEKIQSMKVIFA